MGVLAFKPMVHTVLEKARFNFHQKEYVGSHWSSGLNFEITEFSWEQIHVVLLKERKLPFDLIL